MEFKVESVHLLFDFFCWITLPLCNLYRCSVGSKCACKALMSLHFLDQGKVVKIRVDFFLELSIDHGEFIFYLVVIEVRLHFLEARFGDLRNFLFCKVRIELIKIVGN